LYQFTQAIEKHS